MGVIIGGMAAIGLAGGIMGGMGQQQQQQAQYHQQRMEAERQNYLNQRATDDANWAAARKAAITARNNKNIAETAVKSYADARRSNRIAFQNNAHALASQWLTRRNSMITEATGKNLRGGMVDRMMSLSSTQAARQRLQNRMSYFQADEAAKNNYQSQLNQRDMLTRVGTTLHVPSPMPIQPESGLTLGMLGSMLGGAVGGASAGAGIYGNIK